MNQTTNDRHAAGQTSRSQKAIVFGGLPLHDDAVVNLTGGAAAAGRGTSCKFELDCGDRVSVAPFSDRATSPLVSETAVPEDVL